MFDSFMAFLTSTNLYTVAYGYSAVAIRPFAAPAPIASEFFFPFVGQFYKCLLEYCYHKTFEHYPNPRSVTTNGWSALHFLGVLRA
jgi:hypothetical protein